MNAKEAAREAVSIVIKHGTGYGYSRKTSDIADAIEKPVQQAIDDAVKEATSNRCEHCGAKLNLDGCVYCGAPVCCPQCCQITTLQTETKALRTALANLVEEASAWVVFLHIHSCDTTTLGDAIDAAKKQLTKEGS